MITNKLVILDNKSPHSYRTPYGVRTNTIHITFIFRSILIYYIYIYIIYTTLINSCQRNTLTPEKVRKDNIHRISL